MGNICATLPPNFFKTTYEELYIVKYYTPEEIQNMTEVERIVLEPKTYTDTYGNNAIGTIIKYPGKYPGMSTVIKMVP